MSGKPGWHHTQEFKDKLRAQRMGSKNPFFGKTHSEEYCKQVAERARRLNLGKKHSEKSRLLMSLSHLRPGINRYKLPALKKEKHPRWKGGVSPMNEIIRGSLKMQRWKQSIFIRDGYKCVVCSKVGGELNAHHIKRFSVIIIEFGIKDAESAYRCKELWDVNNGVTLCESCHKKEHECKSIQN